MRQGLLVSLLAFGMLAVAAASSTAAGTGCEPAGGAELPTIEAEPGDLEVTGRGWGHGVGMSQYGAEGAAELGCTYEQILGYYFTGSAVERLDTTDSVAVGIAPNRRSAPRPTVFRVRAEDGDVPWTLGDSTVKATQPQGETWRVEADGDRIELRDEDDEVRVTAELGERLDARHDGTEVSSPDKERASYRWGRLEFVPRSGAMTVSSRLPFEKYLRGVDEISPAWPAHALKSQVVAARSFAEEKVRAVGKPAFEAREACNCDLFDSTESQVFRGWYHERRAERWVDAVAETKDEVLTVDGQLRSGNYASSHGGHSQSSAFVWGGERSHLQAVDDSRWDLASANPNRTWARSFSAGEFEALLDGARLGVGTVLDVERGPDGVEVSGTEGTRTILGDRFRTLLGLRSTVFEVDFEVPDGCVPPEAGGLDGIDRLAGPDRVATAIAVAQDFGTADTVVVASSRQFPDALAGGALAATHQGPLLLTAPDTLSAGVTEAITDLSARRVLLLGGTAAVGGEVEGALGAVSGVEEVRRIGGANRFGTAAEIAAEVGASGDEVVLALGQHGMESRAWPDAVAAGGLLAAGEPRPLLLTHGDALPEDTRQALIDLEPNRVMIVGGSAAVADDVEAQVGELGFSPEVDRLAGSDRYGTAIAVAAAAQESAGAPFSEFLAATGWAYPDALAAGALAGERGSPILLMPPCGLEQAPAIASHIEASSYSGGIIIGGTSAVTERVHWDLVELLR